MIRAVFFDFYTVWTPDRFGYYLANAQLNGPEVYKKLNDLMEDYYQGKIDTEYLADAFRIQLGRTNISPEVFRLTDKSISPAIMDFVRSLHGHFLKVGILANLGTQELNLLKTYDERNQLFEIIASPLSLTIPAPLLTRDVFVAALNGIGEPPESTLIVSGNPNLLLFAASLNIKTLQFAGLANLEKSVADLLASENPS